MTTASVLLPRKLIPVFDGPADVRGAYGGRGSAKTRSFAKMLAVRGYIYGMAGIRGQLVCGRQFMNSLEDSSLEEVKRAIEDEPWLLDYYEIGEKYIKSRDGNIWFTFVGLDRNLGSIKSKGRILIFWIDEAEPVTEEAFTVVGPTLREEGTGWNAELWLTWNPKREKAPVERYSHSKDPLIKVVELNHTDNPKFPEKLERERRRDLEERPELYGHIWGGEYLRAVDGAIYLQEMTAAEQEGRISAVPYDPRLKVHLVFDLGHNDAMCVALVQKQHGQLRVIRGLTWRGKTLEYVNAELQPLKLNWGKMFLPHDGENGSYLVGQNARQIMQGYGWNVSIIPKYTGCVEIGIRKAKSMFPRVVFDKDGCADVKTETGSELPGLLTALGQYKRHIPTTTGEPGAPVHDKHSHFADTFRYVAEAEPQMTNDTWGEAPVHRPNMRYV